MIDNTQITVLLHLLSDNIAKEYAEDPKSTAPEYMAGIMTELTNMQKYIDDEDISYEEYSKIINYADCRVKLKELRLKELKLDHAIKGFTQEDD